MINAIGTPEKSVKFSSRDLLLKANSDLIEQLQSRLKAKHFKTQASDPIKLSYIRVFLSSLQVQSSLLRDMELEELKERLQKVEAMQAGSQYREEPLYVSEDDEQDEEEYEYEGEKPGSPVR